MNAHPQRSRRPAGKGFARRTVLFFTVLFILVQPVSAAVPPPRRIVSLAPNLTEMLFDLGLGNRVAGVTEFCDWPAAARAKPRVGGYTNPSLEAIVALRPDLVVMTNEGTPRAVHDRLVGLGIATFVFRAKRLAELPAALRDFGAAVGAARAAERRATAVEKTLRRFTARSGKVRTALFVVQPEPLMVAGPGTVIDDAMTVLGLRNIAAETGLAYPKLNIEEVFRRSPDVIFVGRGSMTGTAGAPLPASWNGLPAVRDGRVYIVGETLFRLSPRVLEGLEEMASMLERTGKTPGKR